MTSTEVVNRVLMTIGGPAAESRALRGPVPGSRFRLTEEARTAAHEAGHCVVGWYVTGVAPKYVTIARLTVANGVLGGFVGDLGPPVDLSAFVQRHHFSDGEKIIEAVRWLDDSRAERLATIRRYRALVNQILTIHEWTLKVLVVALLTSPTRTLNEAEITAILPPKEPAGL